MDERAAIVSGIVLAALPIFYLVLPAPAKSWITARLWPHRRAQGASAIGVGNPNSSEYARSRDKCDLRPTANEHGPTVTAKPNPGVASSKQSAPPPRTFPSFKSHVSEASTDLPPTPQAQDSTDLMPPPALPQPKPSSRTSALSPPTLSAPPSRTTTLAQQKNPQAQRNLASSLAPPSPNVAGSLRSQPTTSTLPAKNRPRQKVVLAPGHSPLDWAHLTATTPSQQLSGVPHLQRVTPSMLAKHDGRKGRPAWSSFRGKVYNISPYLDFHPGGVGELRRGAGKIGDRLFDEIHSWVNVDGMLGSCLVGVLVSESESKTAEQNLDGLD